MPMCRKGCRVGLGAFLLSLALSGGLGACSSTKPDQTVSQFRFEFEGGRYRIRSFNTARVVAGFNELIGDSFLVADLNQDGVIDRVEMGRIDLERAQKIYEFGLERVEAEHRLKRRESVALTYVWDRGDVALVVRTCERPGVEPSNQFEVSDGHDASLAVAIDRDADGILDDVVKGDRPIEELQHLYEAMAGEGIRSGQMARTRGRLVVVR